MENKNEWSLIGVVKKIDTMQTSKGNDMHKLIIEYTNDKGYSVNIPCTSFSTSIIAKVGDTVDIKGVLNSFHSVGKNGETYYNISLNITSIIVLDAGGVEDVPF